MKKLIIAGVLLLAVASYAVNLETPGTFLGPMEVGRLLRTWETNIENAINNATNKFAAGFTTNILVVTSRTSTGQVYIVNGVVTNAASTGF